MKRAAFLAVGFFSVSVFAFAQKQSLPEGKGKATVQRICSTCHGPEIVLGRELTKDGWSQVVVNMIQRGAQGTDDEFADVVDYLTNYVTPAAGKINVNKATAAQLQTALEITGKEAGAIVQYRQQNGDFKVADDLKKVPGIDAKKIDAKKDKFEF